VKCFGKTAFLAVASVFFLVVQAQAISITFGGAEATQGGLAAGLTSSRSGITANGNTADESLGWYIETFDKVDEQGKVTGGFTTLDQDKLTIDGGIAFWNASETGVNAAPAGDVTFHAFTPEKGGTLPASVYVPNTAYNAYDSANPKYIDYMGLYFGSVDLYNSIAFYTSDGKEHVLTGEYILSQHPDSVSGNQLSLLSNVYVNLDFDFANGEIFTAFELRTGAVALEIDNIVTHVTKAPDQVSTVPEPATMLLFGIGLLGLAGVSRKKQ